MIISPEMNKGIVGFSYAGKVKKYKDSRYKVCRDLADNYSTWLPKDIKQREKKLIKWAKERWPY